MPTARGACFCSVLQSFVISCTRDYERPEAVMEEQIAVPFLSFLFYFFFKVLSTTSIMHERYLIANECEPLQSISRFSLEGPRPPGVLHPCSERQVFKRWLLCARSCESPSRGDAQHYCCDRVIHEPALCFFHICKWCKRYLHLHELGVFHTRAGPVRAVFSGSFFVF